MKHITLAILAAAAAGCGSRSPYDVSPDQVQKHVSVMKGGAGSIDERHLPPGAVKRETKFKKGDVLPDGSVADHDGKIVTVEVNKKGP